MPRLTSGPGGRQDIYDFHDVTEGSVLGVQDLFTHIGMSPPCILLLLRSAGAAPWRGARPPVLRRSRMRGALCARPQCARTVQRPSAPLTRELSSALACAYVAWGWGCTALANGKQPMPQAALAWLCEINKSTPTKDGIPVLTQVLEQCL